MKKLRYMTWALALLVLTNCKQMPTVDLLVTNAVIYTVDSGFTVAEAMAVKDGKIVETGTTKALESKYKATSTLDLDGKYVYPGFIDAHCHYYGYGLFSNYAQLKGTTSFNEILSLLSDYARSSETGWIIGRGWDQNDWEEKVFPNNDELNKLFPNRPVILYRIDGHAVLVNDIAFEKAAIDTIAYHNYMVFKNGEFTGVLIDKAADLAKAAIPAPSKKQIRQAILTAQQNCLAVGLTMVHDAGLGSEVVEQLIEMDKNGELKIRIFVMLSPDSANIEFMKTQGVIRTGHLNIGALKLYADGALGSRGAALIQPYSDQPENTGYILESNDYFNSYCQIALDNNYQVCTHCIGDSANRQILNIYSNFLQPGNDKRWRIEHAQVVDPADVNLFGKYNIIPSVQPTHATSDMYWAGQRLGDERVKNGYAYRNLLEQNGWLPAGSDFPVESINPLFGYYAAVARQDQDHYPPEGFQVENALSKQQALRAMTIWAAKAGFWESVSGSIERDKSADFVVLDTDIIQEDIHKSFRAVVLKTFIRGELCYEQEE